MKKILFSMMVISVILISCTEQARKKAETTSKRQVTETEAKDRNHNDNEFLSVVDTPNIKDFNDYRYWGKRLFDEYSTAKNKALITYSNKKDSALKEYMQKEQNALQDLRENNYSKYIEWLDAREMENYQKQKEIESSPEFARYLQAKKKAYDKYKNIEDSLYATYRKIKNGCYEEYAAKQDLAYRALKKNQ